MVNVIPLDDEHPHVMGEGCECCPEVRWQDSDGMVFENPVLVHNAYDCREVAEEAEVSSVGLEKASGTGKQWGVFDP